MSLGGSLPFCLVFSLHFAVLVYSARQNHTYKLVNKKEKVRKYILTSLNNFSGVKKGFIVCSLLLLLKYLHLQLQ